MADFLVIGIILFIVGSASVSIWKAKKSGIKCIGCPSTGKCSGHTESTVCSCGCDSTVK